MRTHEAIEIMEQAAKLALGSRHYAVGTVALLLDCSPKYVKEHLGDFPNAWRMSGGEIRIPARDVEALVRARRFLKTGKAEVPA